MHDGRARGANFDYRRPLAQWLSRNQYAAGHILRVQTAVIPVQTGVSECKRHLLPGLDMLIKVDLVIYEPDRVRELITVRPGNRSALLHRYLVGAKQVGSWKIDLVRLRSTFTRWLLRSATYRKCCKAQQANDPDDLHSTDSLVGVVLTSPARTVPAKTRTKADRSKTSLSVWAKRKTVQSR